MTARVHDTPAEACAGAEIVVTMFSDGDAVAQAMGRRGSSAGRCGRR